MDVTNLVNGLLTGCTPKQILAIYLAVKSLQDDLDRIVLITGNPALATLALDVTPEHLEQVQHAAEFALDRLGISYLL